MRREQEQAQNEQDVIEAARHDVNESEPHILPRERNRARRDVERDWLRTVRTDDPEGQRRRASRLQHAAGMSRAAGRSATSPSSRPRAHGS